MRSTEEASEAATRARGAVIRVPVTRPDPPPPPPAEFFGIPVPGLRATGIGAALALVLGFLPLLSFLLSPLITIFHELGHTAMFWAFGFSAIPAFDFGEGGGVTLGDTERSPLILLVWGLCLVALAKFKDWNAGLMAFLGIVAILYFVTIRSGWDRVWILAGGHLGVSLLAAVFLYRGLTGWGCRFPFEQPLYAAIAFHILWNEFRLGWILTGTSEEAVAYIVGKSTADSDLVRISDLSNIRLPGVGRLVMLLNAAAIPLTFWAAAIRKTIGAVSEKEETELP